MHLHRYLLSRPALIQVIAAVMALTIGILVYLLDRPGASVYFVPDSWAPGATIPPIFGASGDHLPTFAHTFAFILFTSAVLEPWRWSALVACAWWCVLGSLFEIAQSDAWATVIAAYLPGWFANWPLLDHVADYFLAGQFDLLDLASIDIATVCAFVAIRMSHGFACTRHKKTASG